MPQGISAVRPTNGLYLYLLPPGKTRYPLYRRLGGPQGRSGQVRKILPPPRFDPQTVQPLGSRYTDYPNRPTSDMDIHKYKDYPPHEDRGSNKLHFHVHLYHWQTYPTFVWNTGLFFVNTITYAVAKGGRGGVVVKALRYKSGGRGFDSRWCHRNFSVA